MMTNIAGIADGGVPAEPAPIVLAGYSRGTNPTFAGGRRIVQSPKPTKLGAKGARPLRSFSLPLSMKDPFCVDPLIRVGPEVVPLRLDQIGRQPRTPVPVKIVERNSQSRCRNA